MKNVRPKTYIATFIDTRMYHRYIIISFCYFTTIRYAMCSYSHNIIIIYIIFTCQKTNTIKVTLKILRIVFFLSCWPCEFVNEIFHRRLIIDFYICQLYFSYEYIQMYIFPNDAMQFWKPDYQDIIINIIFFTFIVSVKRVK